MSLFSRLKSEASRRLEISRLKYHGKQYGSYGINEEVDLAISTIKSFSSTINKKTIVLDIGANKGEYAKALLSKLGEDIEIHCFEPSADHCETLNALQLDNPGKVFYHSTAISSKNESRILFKDQRGSGLASLYERDLACHGLSLDQQEQVSTSTIDDWMNVSHLHEISFAKIDVEGHELDIFKGAAQALSESRILAVQFEFGGCNIDSRTFIKDFHSLLVRNYQYRLYRLAPGKVLVDLNSYNEDFECFTWQNLLAFSNARFIPPDYQLVFE
ncbi:FkbM family methyltransferase [Cyanobium sp. ULC084]